MAADDSSLTDDDIEMNSPQIRLLLAANAGENLARNSASMLAVAAPL